MRESADHFSAARGHRHVAHAASLAAGRRDDVDLRRVVAGALARERDRACRRATTSARCSFPVVYVSCVCVLPSVESSQRFDELSSLSTSQVVTSTTHHWPSGDTDGGPTRLTFQRSSAVIGPRVGRHEGASEAIKRMMARKDAGASWG